LSFLDEKKADEKSKYEMIKKCEEQLEVAKNRNIFAERSI